MKTVKMLTVAAMALVLNAGLAFSKDEPYLDAAHKVKGEYIRSHEVQTYQRSAQDKAHTLYYYGQAQQPIPKKEAQELVGGIRKDLTSADKALAALKTKYAKDANVVKQIEVIEKHHKKAHEVCGMAEAECAKEHGDHVVVGDCCSEMWHELDAAQAETTKLLKMLKLDKLPPPPKAAPKKDAPKKAETKK
jgi:hypothetical protein